MPVGVDASGRLWRVLSSVRGVARRDAVGAVISTVRVETPGLSAERGSGLRVNLIQVPVHVRVAALGAQEATLSSVRVLCTNSRTAGSRRQGARAVLNSRT
ncbi:hypothetical protein SCHAM137S_06574 [Streptomyces chartreusis]